MRRKENFRTVKKISVQWRHAAGFIVFKGQETIQGGFGLKVSLLAEPLIRVPFSTILAQFVKSLVLFGGTALNHGWTAARWPGWRGGGGSSVFIWVSGSPCSLSIMEEAISPASRLHHKTVSWYKETRWIITRQRPAALPLPASPIASVSLIDRRAPFLPVLSLSLSFLCSASFFWRSSPLSLSALMAECDDENTKIHLWTRAVHQGDFTDVLLWCSNITSLP